LKLSAIALCTTSVFAQQTRPNSGTLLEPQRQIPTLPAPGGAPTVVVPPAPAAAAFNPAVRVTPTAFRIQGNTLFSEAELLPLVNEFVGKPTDMEGLLKAAGAVRRYYRDRGYLLTEAYLPQQQFPAGSGPVTIQVLEARVGKVAVQVEGEGISESLAGRIVRNHLHPGDYISEYSLDKPVLLLRDLAGFDATASVTPGSAVGEADITVIVKPYGPKFDGVIGLDNYGVRSAGELRGYVGANVNNLLGWGDSLNVRAQTSERQDTNLYRIGYAVPINGYATKLGLSVTKTDYALGKQFAPLGASGDATIYGISLTHPFIRSRANNVLGGITVERKDLHDDTTTPPSSAERRVDSVRLSVLGNWVDSVTMGSFNSYALNFTSGKVDLDPTTRAIDQGAAGLNTEGNFSKVNVEYLRTTYLSAKGRISAALQAQIASKNLTSAEKFALGGPTGVRGYPVGEAVGDSGAVINLEYQHQLGDFGTGIPLAASVFYDWGHIKYNENNPTGVAAANPNTENLSSAGLGFTMGTFGKYLLTTQVAWRLDRAPAGGEPDRHPRVWVSLQKWLP
jgi:hemolysin activation/secretion protein